MTFYSQKSTLGDLGTRRCRPLCGAEKFRATRLFLTHFRPRRAGARTEPRWRSSPRPRTHPRCRASRWRCASSRWTSRRETSRPTIRLVRALRAAPCRRSGRRLAVSDASTWNTEEFAFDHVYGAFERTKGGVDMSADAAAHRHSARASLRGRGRARAGRGVAGHNVGVFAVGHSGAGARHAMRGDDAIPQTADASRAANGLLPSVRGRTVRARREGTRDGNRRRDESRRVVRGRRGDRARDLCAHETGSANIVNTTGPVRVRVDSAEKMRRLLRGALEQAATPGASAEDPGRRAKPSRNPRAVVESRVEGSRHDALRRAGHADARFLRGVPAKTLAATRAGALEAARDAPLVSEATLVELCGFERARADDSARELVEAVSSAANEASRQRQKRRTKTLHPAHTVTLKAPLSRLTRRCRPGGDAMTWVVAAVSPRDDDADATLAAPLRFASAFRNVRCLSRRNVDPDAELFVETESEARAVEGEVERLAKALAAARARRAEAPAKRASFGRRATFDPRTDAESESEETDRLRMALRDARAARDAVERRRRAGNAQVDREARALRREREAPACCPRRTFPTARGAGSHLPPRRSGRSGSSANGDALCRGSPTWSSRPRTASPPAPRALRCPRKRSRRTRRPR